MAELVDALVSDASGATRGSSSLLGRTTLFLIYFFELRDKLRKRREADVENIQDGRKRQTGKAQKK